MLGATTLTARSHPSVHDKALYVWFHSNCEHRSLLAVVALQHPGQREGEDRLGSGQKRPPPYSRRFGAERASAGLRAWILRVCCSLLGQTFHSALSVRVISPPSLRNPRISPQDAAVHLFCQSFLRPSPSEQLGAYQTKAHQVRGVSCRVTQDSNNQPFGGL